MKIELRLMFVSLIFGVIVGSGCGVVVGNPDDPDDEEPKAFIPTIGLSFPEKLSGFSLLNPNSVLQKFVNRTDKSIERVNRLLDKLNQSKVKEKGVFSGKGDDGLISGSVIELSGQSYDYQGTICYDNQPLQVLRWTEDGSKIYSLRDHSIDPTTNPLKSAFISEITYVKDSGESVLISIDGEPFTVPEDAIDGSSLVETVNVSLIDGTYNIKGVNNWYAGEADVSTDTDEYIVGTFDSEGGGEFVAFRDFDPRCEDEFNPAQPAWCLGRSIDGERFNDEEREEAAIRLQSVGIQPAASLRNLTMSGYSCPE